MAIGKQAMWWVTLAIVSLGTLVGLYLLWRAVRAERNRVNRWDNLRERSKLIASQLSHLRDVQAQKKTRR